MGPLLDVTRRWRRPVTCNAGHRTLLWRDDGEVISGERGGSVVRRR